MKCKKHKWDNEGGVREERGGFGTKRVVRRVRKCVECGQKQFYENYQRPGITMVGWENTKW